MKRFANAVTIDVNTLVNGVLIHSDDERCYRFLVRQSGYVEIKFNHEFVDSVQSHWAVRMYNAEFEELIYRSVSGKELFVTLPELGISAGAYYIRITHAACCSNKPYNLIVKYSAFADRKGRRTLFYDTACHVTNASVFQKSFIENNMENFAETFRESYDYVKISLYQPPKAISPCRDEKKIPEKLEENQQRSDNGFSLQIRLTADNKAKLTWQKLSGADGYEIYRTSKRNGNYKKRKDIADKNITSYKDRGVAAGKIYYYKIKAYRMKHGKKVCDMDASAGSVKISPFQTGISGISSPSPKTVRLTWNKADGADGYQIYRAAGKNGAYKKAAAVKSGKITAYTDNGLKSNKVYSYKVRPYRLYKGKKVHGDYSAAECVKVT